ncbi:hypothetical protein BsWGS_16240 [Bradybaena similaris]
MAEVQECLTSSDDEPADVYRSSQFLTSAANLDLSGSEVYRLAINSVGRSSAHRAEAELNSDKSNDTDTTAGKPLPSLVNAEEDVGDDWLVNDIQWPQATRKSCAVSSVLTTSSSRSTAKKRLRHDVHVKISDQASKRHKCPLPNGDRQTVRKSVEESRPYAIRPGDQRKGITAGNFQRNLTTHFAGSYESSCRTAVQALNGSDSNITLSAEMWSVTEKFEKPTYVNSIRVKVKIGQQMLLIPIQPADQDKNISWLFQQVKERYFSMFLMLPTLTLSTQDGIMLCPADTISTVVQDNDVLTANVSAWERPKLEDRYVQACKLCLTNADTNIISVLQTAGQTRQLLLSDMGLGLSYLQPVFQALDDHKILTDLRLNGNRLGDAGIESLMKLLPRLPHLKILSLETNEISADGIQTMAAALKSDLCLQHLTTLSLSHNCLDDLAALALACVLRSLPNLCHLSLCSCNFSRKLFSSSLAEALKVRRIEHLDISENNIGAEGVRDLLRGLDPACLRQLNVSHTCSTSDQMSPHLQGFISSGTCCLQELSVAGNQLSPADVSNINILPVLIKSLRCLVLSQNQNVNNKNLQKLLYLSADKDSALSEITARGCSITSPLESEFLEAMRSKMSSSVPLNKFVFTCRGLKAGDTQLLEEIWSNTWKDQGQVKADGITVYITVL